MKLSIAIPAYNAEKTLERTVATVLAQTFTDFEVLIVNNGSKDRTGEIARQLAARDPRIQVFDVYPNIWGYGARLYAWKRAKGEYITTVDADDFISPEMYETMLAVATQHNLDVVECDYDEVASPLPSNSPSPSSFASSPTLSQLCETRADVLEKVVVPTFVGVGKSAYVWNKIYRNQYDFNTWEEGVFGSYEDLIHNLQLFRPVRRYGHIAAAFYHYAPNAASVTRNFSASRIDQFAAAVSAKRKLVAEYVLSNSDRILDAWVVNDAKNGVLSAATAGALTVAERADIVRRIRALPAVQAAVSQCSWTNSSALFLRLLPVLPLSLTIRVLQFVRQSRHG